MPRHRLSISGDSAIAALGAAAVFAVLALVVLGSGAEHTRSLFDQNKFHLLAIERFASQWPGLDFSDYESATTPGYHVALAAFKNLTGCGIIGLRIAGSVFTVALVGLLAGWAAARLGRGRAWHAVALSFPLIASMYVLFPGIWLLPDNAAWLGVLGVLLLALRPRITLGTLAAAAGVLLLLVLVRQVHIWVAAPLAAGAALAWPVERDARGTTGSAASRLQSTERTESVTTLIGQVARFAPPIGERGPAVARLVFAALCALPAVLALVWFARLWRGLTPPAFQPNGSSLTNIDYTNVSGMSPATPAFILALVGIFGVFFAAFLWPTLRQRAAVWLPAAATGCLIAGVIAIVPHTNYSLRQPTANSLAERESIRTRGIVETTPSGPTTGAGAQQVVRTPGQQLGDRSRISGLWNIVKLFEDRLQTHLNIAPWSRSPIIVLPAMLGGAWLGVWCVALPRRAAGVLGAALAAFAASQTAGALTWQRYSEPMVLMLLIVAATLVCDERGKPVRFAWVGPLVLGLLQLMNTWFALRAG